jgi:hypothetical protein
VAKPGKLIRIAISFDDTITAALKVKPEPKAKRKAAGTRGTTKKR